MAKNYFWQPFWKMASSGAVEVVRTILDGFLMSINIYLDPNIMIL